MDIIGHLEGFLGKIDQGWKDNDSQFTPQVACFKDSPFVGVDSFVTLGLSNHVLSISKTKQVRQELMFTAYRPIPSIVAANCLIFLAERILNAHIAVLCGETISLPKELSTRLGLDAIYCAMPVFMNDDFATYYKSSPPTVMVWAMPIYNSEADFVRTSGWSRFEDILEEKAPDLFSLGRRPVA